MAKKTSDGDKRYEAEHTRNIARYQRQIDEIYKEAVREAASISSLIRNFSSDKPFKFVDYPITQQRVDKLLKGLKNGITTTIVNGIRHEWSLANTKNDELCNLVLGDSVESLSKSQYGLYFSANIGALEKFIDRKTDGLNLSDRVWNYTSQFKEEIEAGIGLGLMDGKTAPEMAKELKKYLKYPDKLFRRVRDERGILHLSKAAKAFHPGQGVYRSSYKNAMRLARTEVNMAYHEADYARWQNMDFVLGIEIKLSNNHTCLGSDGKAHEFKDICDKLQKRNIDDIAKALNSKATPMTFDEADNGMANVQYRAYSPFGENCQSCVVVHEARLRGLPITALGYSPGDIQERLGGSSKMPGLTRKRARLLKCMVMTRVTTRTRSVG